MYTIIKYIHRICSYKFLDGSSSLCSLFLSFWKVYREILTKYRLKKKKKIMDKYNKYFQKYMF